VVALWHHKIVIFHHPEPGAQPALRFGWGQFSWNFIRWRHRAYSTVVQLFRKRSYIIIMYFACRHEVHSTKTNILYNAG